MLALPAAQPPQADDLLLDGLAALFSDGYPVAVPVLMQALHRMDGG